MLNWVKMLEKWPGCRLLLGSPVYKCPSNFLCIYWDDWVTSVKSVYMLYYIYWSLYLKVNQLGHGVSFSFSPLSASCCSLFLDHSKKKSYCILVFCLYVCVCTKCAWYPQSPEESNRSHETGNTNLCELSCRCQELTLESLQEQGEILPLQLPFSDLLKVFRAGKIVSCTGRIYYNNIT